MRTYEEVLALGPDFKEVIHWYYPQFSEWYDDEWLGDDAMDYKYSGDVYGMLAAFEAGRSIGKQNI